MMSSFVKEIVSSLEKSEKEELTASISSLSKRADALKDELRLLLEAVHVDFIPMKADATNICDKLLQLGFEAEAFSDKISSLRPHLETSAGESEDVLKHLQFTNLVIQALDFLLDIHKLIIKSSEARNDMNYYDESKFLTVALAKADKGIASELVNKVLQMSEIVKSMRADIRERQVDLSTDLQLHWDQFIKWFHDDDAGCESQKSRITLMIESDSEKRDVFTKVVQALAFKKELKMCAIDLGEQLLANVFSPLITRRAICKVFVDKADHCCEIIFENETIPDTDVPCVLDDLLTNICDTVSFLSDHLNFYINKKTDRTLFQMVSSEIEEDISKLIIHELLVHTVPNSSRELKEYSHVVEKIEAFEKFLLKSGFFSEENDKLTNFTTNVDHHFARKILGNILGQARKIMMKDLLQSIAVVGENFKLPMTESSFNSTACEIHQANEVEEIMDKLFQFPKCQISSNTQELIDLLETELRSMPSADPNLIPEIFKGVRGSFELYLIVVPSHHKQITTVPQMAALFHNNCMYIAHCMLTLGKEHMLHLQPNSEQPGVGVMLTFLDLVPKFRQRGAQIFLSCMDEQRKRLMAILKESGFANLGCEQKFAQDAEIAVTKAAEHLFILRDVWQPVLPSIVYSRVIATLANAFLAELVSKVLSLEDMSADVAISLQALFSLIADRIPLLFQADESTDESKVFLKNNIAAWAKFNDLIGILGASLNDIASGWLSGKGPLSMVFTCEEVKHLIRALFQNTERRAAVLAKIK